MNWGLARFAEYCVLVVQFFWPLQPLVSFIAGEKSVDHFKFWVTAVHAAWLILNFYMFLHFINATLRFVEPQSRARLRKQYSATKLSRAMLDGVCWADRDLVVRNVAKGRILAFR
jgi:hypothetical protein